VGNERLPQVDEALIGGRGYDPMHELMRAVILRTVDDYNSTGEFHDEAVDYMFSEEEEYIFSFRAICKHLGIDPDKTRHAIMNATHRISTRRRAA
jgi:hypothetical protein